MKSRGVGLTHQGQSRENNEDEYLIDDQLGLYIVSDGIGAYAAGELAAKIAAESVASQLRQQSALLESVCAGTEPPATALSLVEQAIAKASEQVYQHAHSRQDLGEMGCTLTCLLLLGSKAVMGHVGTTRLYLYRAGVTHQLSTDHTIASDFVASGIISAEEEMDHPYSRVLTRAIGRQPSVPIDTLLIDVLALDRFMLCTNGLSGLLRDPAALAEPFSGSLEDIPRRFVELAKQANAGDDVTVVAVASEGGDAGYKGSLPPPALSTYFEVLAATELLKGLGLEQLQRVFNLAELKRFAAGETLVEQGQVCPGLFLPLSQGLVLEQDGRVVHALDVGQFVGHTGLMQDRKVRSALKAKERGRALFIDRDCFQKMVRQFPRLGLSLLSRLAEQTSAAAERALSQTQPAAPALQRKPEDSF